MMAATLLQLSDYTSGGLLEAALNDLAAAVGGQEMFGLLVGGALLLTFYVASGGGLATPAVFTALSGGVMISTLPPQFRGMAQVIIFLGLVAATLGLFDKMVDNVP